MIYHMILFRICNIDIQLDHHQFFFRSGLYSVGKGCQQIVYLRYNAHE